MTKNDIDKIRELAKKWAVDAAEQRAKYGDAAAYCWTTKERAGEELLALLDGLPAPLTEGRVREAWIAGARWYRDIGPEFADAPNSDDIRDVAAAEYARAATEQSRP